MTTALGEKIKAIIRTNGPLSITDYFSLCLADPTHGYYKTREPFGQSGDFVTAPEISQLFGEMIGVFMVHAWQRHGTPAQVRLVGEQRRAQRRVLGGQDRHLAGEQRLQRPAGDIAQLVDGRHVRPRGLLLDALQRPL